MQAHNCAGYGLSEALTAWAPVIAITGFVLLALFAWLAWR